jgi:hypothetical protein
VDLAHRDKDFQAVLVLDSIVKAKIAIKPAVVVALVRRDLVQKMIAIKDCFVTVALELLTIYWVTHYTGVVAVVDHNTTETQPMPLRAELVAVAEELKHMVVQDGQVLHTQTAAAAEWL